MAAEDVPGRPGAAGAQVPSPKDALAIVVRGWRTVAISTFVCAAAGTVAAFVWPASYQAAASFVSAQQPSAGSAALQQLGGLASLATGAGGLKKSEDLYAALLKADSVQDSIIESFSLIKRYKVDLVEEARRKLAGRTSVYVDKSGLVKIAVIDRDPATAAEMANAYVEVLKRSLSTIAVSEAKQRREFLEARLLEAKSALADAEVHMRRTQERTGLVAVEKQGEALIRTTAELRAQLASREVQMGAMRTYVTPQNVEMQRLASEIAGLKRQLQQAESGSARNGIDVLPPTAKLPESGMEYIRALRDVKFNEAVFEVLARQYEVARLDEARGGAQLQQIDVARAPTERSGPPRTVIALASTVLGAAAGVALLFSRRLLGALRAGAPARRLPS